jgi:hypothetical protein
MDVVYEEDDQDLGNNRGTTPNKKSSFRGANGRNQDKLSNEKYKRNTNTSNDSRKSHASRGSKSSQTKHRGIYLAPPGVTENQALSSR